MNIEVSSTIEREEWERLTRLDGRVGFFQTWEWSDLLVRTLPGYAHSHLVCRVDGTAVACLPALRRTRRSISVLESLPFGTFGGPLVAADATADATEALFGAFGGLVRAPAVAAAQVVDRQGRISESDLPGFARIEYPVQAIALDAPYDELLARFRPSARNKIRKAEKAGVTVRPASGEGDFLAYFEILERCQLDWNVRQAPGRRFFVELAKLDPDHVQMFLAERDGAVMAGDLNLVMNGSIMNWGNVSTEEAKSIGCSNLLHAAAIRKGVESGCHTYDLGGSAGIEGVRAFKASFGAKDVLIARYLFEKRWYRLARRVVRRGG